MRYFYGGRNQKLCPLTGLKPNICLVITKYELNENTTIALLRGQTPGGKRRVSPHEIAGAGMFMFRISTTSFNLQIRFEGVLSRAERLNGGAPVELKSLQITWKHMAVVPLKRVGWTQLRFFFFSNQRSHSATATCKHGRDTWDEPANGHQGMK